MVTAKPQALRGDGNKRTYVGKLGRFWYKNFPEARHKDL